jgi:hypothetical protein
MGKRKKTHEFEDQYGGGAKPQDFEQPSFSKGERLHRSSSCLQPVQ